MDTFTSLFRGTPIVAACHFEYLALGVESRASAILLMNTRLQDLLSDEFAAARERKPIMVHFDFVRGLSADREAVQFLKEHVGPAALVSTRGPAIRAAQKEGIPTVQRVFLIDTQSFQKTIGSVLENDPDAVEIMPGIAPSIVSDFKREVDKPLMLGGLIHNQATIQSAFDAGADAVSLSKVSLWNWRAH
jgi:glycerol uptake operon antiterminator